MVENQGKTELSRAVRFAIDLSRSTAPSAAAAAPDPAQSRNSFAGLPSMRGLGAHYEMIVSVRGEPDRATGYLMNISAIDRAARTHAIPIIAHAVAAGETAQPSSLLIRCARALQPPLGNALHSLRWQLTPYYSLAMTVDAPDRVQMRQSFEFAAAHRLHSDALDPQTNREIFGKCNSPSGHGHNYRIEVAVDAPIDAGGNMAFSLQRLEQIVDDLVIKRFDHKHLNKDTAEFVNINPSVENIARVCHGLLAQPLDQAGARLACVTVWETEKTSCSYPA